MEEFRVCKGCKESKPNNSIYFEERVSKSGKLYSLSTCRVCYNNMRKEKRKKGYNKINKEIKDATLKAFVAEKELLIEELIKRKTILFEEYNKVYMEIKKLKSTILTEKAKYTPRKRKATLVKKSKEKVVEISETSKVIITPKDRVKYGSIIKQLEKINNKGKL